jgi:hypothetical protein
MPVLEGRLHYGGTHQNVGIRVQGSTPTIALLQVMASNVARFFPSTSPRSLLSLYSEAMESHVPKLDVILNQRHACSFVLEHRYWF